MYPQDVMPLVTEISIAPRTSPKVGPRDAHGAVRLVLDDVAKKAWLVPGKIMVFIKELAVDWGVQ